MDHVTSGKMHTLGILFCFCDVKVVMGGPIPPGVEPPMSPKAYYSGVIKKCNDVVGGVNGETLICKEGVEESAKHTPCGTPVFILTF